MAEARLCEEVEGAGVPPMKRLRSGVESQRALGHGGREDFLAAVARGVMDVFIREAIDCLLVAQESELDTLDVEIEKSHSAPGSTARP